MSLTFSFETDDILKYLQSRGCLQRRILQNVNLDPFHMVVDQCLGLDSLLILYSGRSMSAEKPTSNAIYKYK